MKSLHYIMMVAVLSSGCDDSFDALDALNSAPVVSFSAQNISLELTDSVKVSAKVGALEYTGKIYLSDKEGGVNAVKYEFVKKEGSLSINGISLAPGEPFIIGDINSLEFIVTPESGLGEYQIKIFAVDDLGESGTGLLTLIAYENLEPVAKLDVSKLGLVSELEYTLDGSDSYDRDTSLGGGLVRYQFTLNSTDFPLVATPSLKFIFPGPGGYEIKLKVQDNDGVWSDQVVEIVTVL